MQQPLVSIIIPTFNYGHLIRETLASVLSQTYQNWECVIVDDGSSDDTSKVVADFVQAHSGNAIHYLYIDNSGTSVAKNIGIKSAKGKYLQFLDADDLLSPDKLSIQLQQLEKTGAEMVFSKARFFEIRDGEKKYVTKYPDGYLAEQSLSGEDLISRLIENNLFVISSPLVKADLIRSAGMFIPELKNNEDWLLWFRTGLLSPRFIYDNDPSSFAEIRIHGKSAMNQKRRMADGETYVRQIMDIYLNGSMKKANLEKLALHRIRSLDAWIGYRYILTNFVKDPLRQSKVLLLAVRNTAARIYRRFFNYEK